jgi:hypothetical protein
MEAAAATGSLFGRERELAQIQGFLERAATSPAGIDFEGEPGIGKTTLWRAGADAARARERPTRRPAGIRSSRSNPSAATTPARSVHSLRSLWP